MQEKQPQLKFEDPFKSDPSRKGMLLSNQIEWFCKRGFLIEKGYSEQQVRPASYTLTIGPEYVDSTGWNARLEMCQWRRETLDKESIWDEVRSTSLSRW